MSTKGSSKRYAEVIFVLAEERQELEAWIPRLQALVEMVEIQEFRTFLESPHIHMDEKVSVIQDILRKESPLVKNLLALLTLKRHLRLVPAILQEYQHLANASLGVQVAQVVTAVPLEPEEQAQIAEYLSKMVNREVRIRPQVDSTLLGGFVARLQDRLIDGSTRTRLLELRRQLLTGSI